MNITESSIDDLLMTTYLEILQSDIKTISTSKGPTQEIIGATLTLDNPRARFSRAIARNTFFSCLGEFLWYVAGSDDLQFIEYYIPDYRRYVDQHPRPPGAYGPRLFRYNQGIPRIIEIIRGIAGGYQTPSPMHQIINLLKKKTESRQAVIPIYSTSDLYRTNKNGLISADIPCTCTLQYLVRGNKLHAITYMRSNDALRGLPHDIFSFTMIQELIARSLNVDLGEYKHIVGSLHIYERDKNLVESFIDEGYQTLKYASMPPMPFGDQWGHLKQLLVIERQLRTRNKKITVQLPEYWNDLALILEAHNYWKTKYKTGNVGTKEALARLLQITQCLSSENLSIFLERRSHTVLSRAQGQQEDTP